jgi:hypothetical protein
MPSSSTNAMRPSASNDCCLRVISAIDLSFYCRPFAFGAGQNAAVPGRASTNPLHGARRRPRTLRTCSGVREGSWGAQNDTSSSACISATSVRLRPLLLAVCLLIEIGSHPALKN